MSHLADTELNVSDENASDATRFAIAHQCNAIIVPPKRAAEFVVERFKRGGKFKIITAVDFPNGRSFALAKFMSVGEDMRSVNGYDVALSPQLNEIQALAEIRLISQLLEEHFGQLYEVRWVIPENWHTSIASRIQGMMGVRTSMFRTTSNISTSLGVEEHTKIGKAISAASGRPIKYGGGVTPELIKNLTSRGEVYFDITMAQGENLLSAGGMSGLRARGGANITHVAKQ